MEKLDVQFLFPFHGTITTSSTELSVYFFSLNVSFDPGLSAADSAQPVSTNVNDSGCHSHISHHMSSLQYETVKHS